MWISNPTIKYILSIESASFLFESFLLSTTGQLLRKLVSYNYRCLNLHNKKIKTADWIVYSSITNLGVTIVQGQFSDSGR